MQDPVDWVGLRWDCTSTSIALALLEQVRADVKEFNLHSAARKLSVSGDCSEFTVTVESNPDQDGNPICFILESDRIAIRRGNKPEIAVT